MKKTNGKTVVVAAQQFERTFPKFDKSYRMARATKIMTRNMTKSVRKMFILADIELLARERSRGKATKEKDSQ